MSTCRIRMPLDLGSGDECYWEQHYQKAQRRWSVNYSLHGDGELQEGQIWEAAMFASAKKIDNIIVTVDLNGKQIDGSTDEVLPMGSIRSKFEAFGWEVLDIVQGNDIEAIKAGMSDAKTKTGKGKPVCVLLHTEMGNR